MPWHAIMAPPTHLGKHGGRLGSRAAERGRRGAGGTVQPLTRKNHQAEIQAEQPEMH